MAWQAISPCLSCLAWLKLNREEDPERQPLFPAPDTVLSPPRRRPGLPPIQPGPPSVSDPCSNGRTPTPGRLSALGRGWSSPGPSSRGRERMGSISRAYQGRMHHLSQHSQPTTPAAVAPMFPYHPRSSSSTLSGLTPPAQRHTTPSSPVTAAIPESEEPSPRDITAANFRRDHHKRLSVPYLGRSVSEPRSLSHLAEMDKPLDHLFASHQMPGRSGIGSGLVRRGRPRSATFFERMSPLPGRETSADEGDDEDSDVGAHAGPSGQGWSMFVSGRDDGVGIVERNTSVASEMDGGFAHEEAHSEPERQTEARDREVVRVNLGLRGLGTVGSLGRKARRGKTGRGRGTSG